MERRPVRSTDISTVGYDSKTQALEVEFGNGNTYQYFGVPRSLYDRLMAADSKGKFLSAHIKGKYRYARKQETNEHP